MKKLFLSLTLITSVMLLWSFISVRKDSNTIIEPDSVFVKVAASSSMLEVELGNMAMQKASHQRVKDFASKMVQEHTQASQELASLATSKKFTMPTAMLQQHSKQVEALTNLTGTEFDRKYMDIMVEEHKEDVDEFEDAAEKATDADVKAWAAKMLPHLKMHLDTARNLLRFVQNNYVETTDSTTTITMQNTSATNSSDEGAVSDKNAIIKNTNTNKKDHHTMHQNHKVKTETKKEKDNKKGGNY